MYQFHHVHQVIIKMVPFVIQVVEMDIMVLAQYAGQVVVTGNKIISFLFSYKTKKKINSK